jgi:hypothetical protein
MRSWTDGLDDRSLSPGRLSMIESEARYRSEAEIGQNHRVPSPTGKSAHDGKAVDLPMFWTSPS